MQLPSNYGSVIIRGLKDNTHSASFTLVPRTADTSNDEDFASRFTGGSHFRVHGMEVMLLGVVPKPEALKDGVADVAIQISTSGVYSDIQDDKVYHFTTLPLQRRFEYTMTASGETDTVLVKAIYPTKDHAEPTPFTQWTIEIKDPSGLDLTGLTGVELRWEGTARYNN